MTKRSKRAKQGGVGVLAVVALAIVAYLVATHQINIAIPPAVSTAVSGVVNSITTPSASDPVAPPAASGSAAAGLPVVNPKSKPKEITFQGCPPEGDGGDPQLNLLKNRVDDAASYTLVNFDAVEKLAWPSMIERKDRDNWSAADTASVARYEGIPIAVEGYLFDAKQSGAESTNCHATDAEMSDWHIWLTKGPNDDRTNSIVVETTPRVRDFHPNWTLSNLRPAIKAHLKVRISGWLFLDPEHPDQVNQTRGTIWEIHPIMRIDIQQNGQWIPLDKFNG
jgi:hypothetical protein